MNEISGTQILCNIKEPQTNGKVLHTQIFEKLNSKAREAGREIKAGEEGPTIVTIVNALPNAQINIKRDIAAANLTSIGRMF